MAGGAGFSTWTGSMLRLGNWRRATKKLECRIDSVGECTIRRTNSMGKCRRKPGSGSDGGFEANGRVLIPRRMGSYAYLRGNWAVQTITIARAYRAGTPTSQSTHRL